MKNSKKYYHNKGERDATKGIYNPPHGVWDTLTTWTDNGMKKLIEENEAYNTGYYHAKGQIDYSKGRYNAPNDRKSKESYDKGYNGNKTSSGCFITTATMLSLGKNDECEELNMFKAFRDDWLLHQAGGEKLIKEYYRKAPLLVTLINRKEKSNEIYIKLWEEFLKPSYLLIKQKKYNAALKKYKNMIKNLENIFCEKTRKTGTNQLKSLNKQIT